MNKTLEILENVGALVRNGHFVYTEGDHGSDYINKDALYPHTRLVQQVATEIAKCLFASKTDTIVSPAIGAIALGFEVARILSCPSWLIDRPDIRFVYAEKSKDGEKFVIERGFDTFVAYKRVWVIEDILNTGGSVKKVVQAVQNLHGQLLGVGALCNRGGVTAEHLEVPTLFSLCELKLEKYKADDCPLCKKGVPINVELGKGKEYLAKN
jgi:orotate phosphoribosyltransferase